MKENLTHLMTQNCLLHKPCESIQSDARITPAAHSYVRYPASSESIVSL